MIRNRSEFLYPIIEPLLSCRKSPMAHYEIILQAIWNWTCANAVWSEEERVHLIAYADWVITRVDNPL